MAVYTEFIEVHSCTAYLYWAFCSIAKDAMVSQRTHKNIANFAVLFSLCDTFCKTKCLYVFIDWAMQKLMIRQTKYIMPVMLNNAIKVKVSDTTMLTDAFKAD